jgi:hypothetical protein
MFRRSLLVLVLAAGSAAAAPIRIEPDDYADGTVLNTINPAVTLFTAVNATDLTSNFGFNVTAQTDASGHTATGTKVFAHVGIPFFNSTRNLRMTFTNPIAQLALDFIPSTFNEAGTLALYNAAGQLITTLTVPNPQTDIPRTLSFSRPTADVKYVVASGTGPFVRIDALRFDAVPAAVPEPFSIAVFGGLVGVGGLVARRRMRMA